MSAPTLRISGPVDLIKAVPYLLGFTPVDSLVLIALDGGSLVCTARIDLADIADAPGSLLTTLGAIHRGGGRQVVAVIFSDEPAPRPGQLHAADLVQTLREQAAQTNMDLTDALLVRDNRWWSYFCPDPECCPPEGRPIVDTTPCFEAGTALLGKAPKATRSDLAAQFDNLGRQITEEQVATFSYIETDELRARQLKREVFAAARKDGGWTGAQLAAYLAGLQVTPIRDAVWLAVEDGRLDGRPLWQELSRRAQGKLRAAPLFLYAWTSWRTGGGATANIATDLALQADPTYSAADLLSAALVNGLNPHQVPKLRKS